MSNRHSYATGAATGTRAQYTSIGGTDSLAVTRPDTTGTVTVIDSVSSYSTRAIQLDSSATASERVALQTTETSGSTEFRAHFILDTPTLTTGQWVDLMTVAAGGTCTLSINASGAFQFSIAGTQVYNSGNAKLPAAGVKIRVSVALSLTAWSVALFNDDSNVLLASASGTTVALSGTFGSLFLGKATWQSATSLRLIFRAIRVEKGLGCAAAILPPETALTPKSGSSVAPIRMVSVTGTAPTPTGAAAVTNLSDGNVATNVVIPAGSEVRFALTPLSLASLANGTTFLFPQSLASVNKAITVKLWRANGDGTQIGSTKTVDFLTTAEDRTATFSAAEVSGLTSAEAEAIEMTIGVAA